MAIGRAFYKKWTLLVAEPYEGMAVFFVLSPGYDPRCFWGIRRSFELAVEAGSELITIEAAAHERSSKGRS